MIATVVDEISALLPVRVQKATVSATGLLVLELYVVVDKSSTPKARGDLPRSGDNAGHKRWVTVDAGAVRLSRERPAKYDGDPSVPPPALQGLVRKELVPAVLASVDVDGAVVRLRFTRIDGKDRLVMVELTRDPRAVVVQPVDEGLRILGVLGEQKAKDGRDLRRGRIYVPPSAASAAGDDVTRASSADRPRVDPALLELRARVRAEKKRLKRLVDALSGDLVKHKDPQVHEEAGELLKTALARLKRGDASVDVVDWQGEARTIALEPALDPKENLERFFKKAKKARAAIARTKPRLDDAMVALARVDEIARQLALHGPSPAVIDGARALLADKDSGGSARRRAAKAGKRQAWRSFKCTGDVVVRVGRGAKDNDALVKSARGHDLWLHARGLTGAHVVVPAGAGDVDAELVLDAAHLAAHFSAARGEARVDIQHTRIKNLKKPGAGAAAGLVHVSLESVLHLRVDDARVQRLLASEVPA